MAIGPLDHDKPIQHAGNWTIMRMGGATPANYRRSANSAQRAYRRTQDKGQRQVIASMVTECKWIEDWLTTGRMPGVRRGVENRNERYWDPAWIDSYYSPNGWKVERTESRDLTDLERFKIEEAMRDLSPRERQCFLLHVMDGMSYGDISAELHIGRTTVQDYVENAKQKIEYAKLTNLFLS